jgi:hypothetical protein
MPPPNPPMTLHTFIDAWIEHPIAGLPLRMIYLCEWHAVHGCLATAAGAILLPGLCLDNLSLIAVGVSLALPSLACFALWAASIPLLILLETILPNPADRA